MRRNLKQQLSINSVSSWIGCSSVLMRRLWQRTHHSFLATFLHRLSIVLRQLETTFKHFSGYRQVRVTEKYSISVRKNVRKASLAESTRSFEHVCCDWRYLHHCDCMLTSNQWIPQVCLTVRMTKMHWLQGTRKKHSHCKPSSTTFPLVSVPGNSSS